MPRARRALRVAGAITRVSRADTCLGRGGSEDRVSGRAVLVTGAARGIGRAVADAFAGWGDRVALHYGSSADLAVELLARLPGSGHVAMQADLADPAVKYLQ
jgi:NADP-dependent 3-hydroxy acid dehydrogenase YdfG